jgi:hypothetical protein
MSDAATAEVAAGTPDAYGVSYSMLMEDAVSTPTVVVDPFEVSHS